MDSHICSMHKLPKTYLCKECKIIHCSECSCIHILERHASDLLGTISEIYRNRKEGFNSRKQKIEIVQDELAKCQKKILEFVKSMSDETSFIAICKKFENQFIGIIQAEKARRNMGIKELLNFVNKIAQMRSLQSQYICKETAEFENLDANGIQGMYQLCAKTIYQNSSNEESKSDISEAAIKLYEAAKVTLQKIREEFNSSENMTNFEKVLSNLFSEVKNSLNLCAKIQIEPKEKNLILRDINNHSTEIQKMHEIMPKVDEVRDQTEQALMALGFLKEKIVALSEEYFDYKDKLDLLKKNMQDATEEFEFKKKEFTELQKQIDLMNATTCKNGCKKVTCVDCGHECTKCGIFSCKNCSELCKTCQHYFCLECSKAKKRCQNCNSILCEECIRECNKCHESFCIECSAQCVKCLSEFSCKACSKICRACENTICGKCIETAENKPTEGKTTRCSNCEDFTCSKCAKKVCVDCQMHFCVKCIDKICMDCGNSICKKCSTHKCKSCDGCLCSKCNVKRCANCADFFCAKCAMNKCGSCASFLCNACNICGGCKKISNLCKNCNKKQCSSCGKSNLCAQCLYQCEKCNKAHCAQCSKGYKCPKCEIYSCCVIRCKKCSRILIPLNEKMYEFASTSQFTSSNTSHWNPGNMLDSVNYNQFAFDGCKYGWVLWNMSANPKKITHLIYNAQYSGNTMAVEYSNDGSNFTEATQFVDNNELDDIPLNLSGTFSYWRIRVVSHANRNRWHNAVWCTKSDS